MNCEKCRSTSFEKRESKINGILFGLRTFKYICNSCGYSKYIQEKEVELK